MMIMDSPFPRRIAPPAVPRVSAFSTHSLKRLKIRFPVRLKTAWKAIIFGMGIDSRPIKKIIRNLPNRKKVVVIR